MTTVARDFTNRHSRRFSRNGERPITVRLHLVNFRTGTFGGYQARAGLVRAVHAPDIAIATPEDLIAIGFGLLLVAGFIKSPILQAHVSSIFLP
jgi:hypothetical protein